MPRTNSLFDSNSLKQSKVFSIVDMCSGYWQVPMQVNYLEKLTFMNRFWSYSVESAWKNFHRVFQRTIRGHLIKNIAFVIEIVTYSLHATIWMIYYLLQVL